MSIMSIYLIITEVCIKWSELKMVVWLRESYVTLSNINFNFLYIM